MLRVPGALAVVLFVAGCSSSAPAGGPTAEDPAAVLEAAFLKEARRLEEDPDGAKVDDEQLLKMGHIVCKALREGDITEPMRSIWVMDNYPGEPGIVSAALAATLLCPDWMKS